MRTLDYWLGEVRAGFKLRNHANEILRRRNRTRIRYAIRQIKHDGRCIVCGKSRIHTTDELLRCLKG